MTQQTTQLIVVGIAITVALLALLTLMLRRRSYRQRARGEDVEDIVPVAAERELSPVVERMLSAPALQPARLTIPPRAEHAGRVPSPGVLHVGGVDLPAGRPTRQVQVVGLELATTDGHPPVGSEQLWVASSASLGAPALWKQLAGVFEQTGLWPLLLPRRDAATAAAWIDEGARRHGSPRGGVAERLCIRLLDSLSGGSPLESTQLLASSAAAQGELSRGSGRRLDALNEAFTQLGTAQLALAPARRPADVLHAIAWPGAEHAGIPTAELADIIASWEERYGVLLVGLDDASLVLAVLQPPSSQREAIEALAELHALCPDEAESWQDDRTGAQQLVDAAVWTLSWR